MERRGFLAVLVAGPLAAGAILKPLPPPVRPELYSQPWWEGDKAFCWVTAKEHLKSGDMVQFADSLAGVACENGRPHSVVKVQVHGPAS